MPKHDRRTFLKISGGILGGIAVGSTVTAASRTDRFIVKTNNRVDFGALSVVHELSGVDYAVVRGEESAVENASGVVDYAPDIEVELDDPSPIEDTPTVAEASAVDEPGYELQWDKQTLDVPTAHETTKGEGTRVTIIDTGVAGGHPDLEVNEELSRNFTGDGLGAANAAGGYHGTHVGGIVAARTDNEAGVAGTAPETDLVDCRVFSPNALASFGDILAAIDYSAAIDADVANLSLGAYPIPRPGLGEFYGKLLNRIMTYANRQGTLLVIAAGNDGADLQHDKNFISLPNEGAQGVSVSATGPVGFMWDPFVVGDDTESADSPAIYTNYGTNAIDIAAPGGDYSPEGYLEYYDDDDGDGKPDKDFPPWYFDLVLNTVAYPSYETNEDDEVTNVSDHEYTYTWVAGTSMAAPQVAGAAALVKSVNPDYTADQVETALEKAAEVPDDYDKTFYGAGFLNIVDAL